MMTPSLDPIQIELWRAEDPDITMLGDMLHDTVHAGADIGFILPFSRDDAAAFWRNRIKPAVAAGTCRVLVARCDGRIVGTVQINLATPANQPHRAEVKKLLVHPDARRNGIAKALMLGIEDQARDAGRTLLTLDTASEAAEKLYLSLGYVRVGVIPGFSRRPDSPALEKTTVMYKDLL